MRLGLVWAKQKELKCLGQLGPENRKMEAIPPPLPPPLNRRALSLQGDETVLPFGAHKRSDWITLEELQWGLCRENIHG